MDGFRESVKYVRADKTKVHFTSLGNENLMVACLLKDVLLKKVKIPSIVGRPPDPPVLNSSTAVDIPSCSTEALTPSSSSRTSLVSADGHDNISINDACPFCKELFDEGAQTSILTERGLPAIETAKKLRKDEGIHCYVGQKVHKQCRERYTNKKYLAGATAQNDEESLENASPNLRSCESTFNYTTDCVFCGNTIAIEMTSGAEATWSKCSTIEMKAKVLTVCDERSDAWSTKVKPRILLVNDLPAADAMYHRQCYSNFLMKKNIPGKHQSEEQITKKIKVGRPKDSRAEKAFEQICLDLKENDDEQTTVVELVEKMKNMVEEPSVCYSVRWMKEKLRNRFKDDIVFTEINGKANVCTFRMKAKNILHEYYKNSTKHVDPEREKMTIITTAAKLIQSDIKNIVTDHTSYPDLSPSLNTKQCLDFLPESMKKFLDVLITSKSADLKKASIGQAIMQASRPRVLQAPLLTGLGVQLHHHYGSRFLIDSLHKHGFTCSYNEVQCFERNAAVALGTEVPNSQSNFTQYVADNVDHNIRTLDGHNTFHGMGMIACSTPATHINIKVPRKQISSADLHEAGRIPILYPKGATGETNLTYKLIILDKANDPSITFDTLWKSSILFHKPRPSWSGTMQIVHKGNHPSKSSVLFLPMIDMDPTNVTCIYSTLQYVADHALRNNSTPILTFDQPLFWKALMLCTTEPEESPLKNIVLKMGGLHTKMSFVGAIGHLMANSGLREVMECIYASNTLDHILSGKAIARAVRAHILVDAALNGLLMSQILKVPIFALDYDAENHGQDDHDQERQLCAELKESYQMMMKGQVLDNRHEESAKTVTEKLFAHAQSLATSRTAKLWSMYMKMVDILKKYIRAERTGNWNLHLEATIDMLPYFAAAGHNSYLKSSLLYLQKMSELQHDHPSVYHHFMNGLHVVRRSEREWAGLSADLVIEQVLMRSLKTSGGLTRGRGMTENQRTIWALSMPICASVNSTMQGLTEVQLATGDQNQDLSQSRMSRDWSDTQKLVEFLKDRSPFECGEGLCNIANGVHAQQLVNVDDSEMIGSSIIQKMEGLKPTEHSFKRKDQAVTLASKTTVKIGEDRVQVDPQLLFQRLSTAGASDLQTALQYELCSYPPALFESADLLLEPQKASLADAIWKLTMPDDEKLPEVYRTVLDGGALLHKIPWTKGSTFASILHSYIEFVKKQYGHPTVVFDGYEASSIKDMTHIRRCKGKQSQTVTFTREMKLTVTKDMFLSNKRNKQRFINMLGEDLRSNDCEVFHDHGDADCLIVTKAIERAEDSNIVLVGDDTDLLILLLYHLNERSHLIFFAPSPKKSARARTWNVKEVKNKLGSYICKHILFIHSMLGCDTTSRLYGLGKGTLLTKLQKSKPIQQAAEIFDMDKPSNEDIERAGEQVLVALYGGKKADSLDFLRHKKFCEKMTTSLTRVEPQSLPPTSAAAKYHSFRVYHQICVWKGRASDDTMQPESWGWKVDSTGFVPLQTDRPPAPENLLKMIRCGCTTDCNSQRCSCRKHGLPCTLACVHCRGMDCNNATEMDPVTEEEAPDGDEDSEIF